MKRSRRTIYCPNCNQVFKDITTRDEMLKYHMEPSTECRKAIHRCLGCNKPFISASCLKQHILKIGNQKCKRAFEESNKKASFTTSNVKPVDRMKRTFLCNEYRNTQMKVLEKKESALEIIHSHRSMATTKCIKFEEINIECIPFDGESDEDSDDDSNIEMVDMEGTKLYSEQLSDDEGMNTLTKDNTSNNKPTSPTKSPTKESNDYNDKQNGSPSISESTESVRYPNNQLHSSEAPRNKTTTNEQPYSNANIGIDTTSINTNTNHGNTRTNSSIHQSNLPPEIAQPCHEFLEPNHLMDILTTKSNEVSLLSDDMDYLASLHLVKMFTEKKMSMNNYNDFMSWYNFGRMNRKKHISFDALIDIATEKTYGETLSKKMNPDVIPVSLQSGRNCYVIAFDVPSMIFDLLNDEALTCSSNMIFSPSADNPFEVELDGEYFDEIDTSLVYQKTFTDLGINTNSQILAPIALYLDELKLDSFGKMGLEPLVMTLLIYNRETRNHHKAHRVIGYLPNLQNLFGKLGYSPDDKANDYHQCLEIIMNRIKRMQRRDGFLWEFKLKEYPDQIFPRRLIFPLFYVIGDAKGNDMLAGRFGSRRNTKCIARDCDVPLNICDNPNHRCNFLRSSVLALKTSDELKELSFRKLKRNAFDGIWFGSQPYGLNAALPPEPLHVFNLGIIERIVESFLSRISKRDIVILDRHVAYNCSHYSKQSDRSYPNMETFLNGISEATKLSAKEKLARVFVIYLTLLSSEFHDEVVSDAFKYEIKQGSLCRMEYYNWLKVFEETLLFSAWVYNERHPKIFFKGGRKSSIARRVRKFMQLYKKYAPREEGKGLKLLKFHHLSHLWWVVRLYGSLLNVDGARGECNNQYLAKDVAKTTQQHHETLNYQTAINSYKRDLILKVIETSIPETGDEGLIQKRTSHSIGGSRFIFKFDYEKKRGKCSWTSTKMTKRSCDFSPIAVEAIYQKLKNYNGGNSRRRIKQIHGFTEFILDDEEMSLVRACPKFRGCRDWHDWVKVSWETRDGNINLNAQVLMFLDASSIVYETYESPFSSIAHDIIPLDIIAFIHSEDESRPCKTMPTEGGNGFSSQLASWHSMEKEYQMVNALTIVSKSFVFVDTHVQGHGSFFPGLATRIITISPKDSWSNVFFDYNDESNKSNARSNRDQNVTDMELTYFEN